MLSEKGRKRKIVTEDKLKQELMILKYEGLYLSIMEKRLLRGITLQKFSELCGIKLSRLKYIDKHRNKATISELIHMGSVVDMDIELLPTSKTKSSGKQDNTKSQNKTNKAEKEILLG